jgi:hypothetical protein
LYAPHKALEPIRFSAVPGGGRPSSCSRGYAVLLTLDELADQEVYSASLTEHHTLAQGPHGRTARWHLTQ